MTPTHVKEHEKLLEQVTCGELERDDPTVLELTERCPECRERLGGLDSVSALLQRAARDQEEVLSSLDLAETAPGSDLVAPYLREQLAHRRRSRWIGYAAAAAVLASAGGGWWLTSSRSGAPDTAPTAGAVLLSSDIRVPAARDGVVPLGPVEWEFTLPDGGYYEVELRTAHGTSLAPPERQQQSVWTPSPEEEETLPDEFELSVTAFDMHNQYVGSVELSVARSR